MYKLSSQLLSSYLLYNGRMDTSKETVPEAKSIVDAFVLICPSCGEFLDASADRTPIIAHDLLNHYSKDSTLHICFKCRTTSRIPDQVYQDFNVPIPPASGRVWH